MQAETIATCMDALVEWRESISTRSNLYIVDDIDKGLARIDAALQDLASQPAPAALPVEIAETMRYAIGYQLDIQRSFGDEHMPWLDRLRAAQAWLAQQPAAG